VAEQKDQINILNQRLNIKNEEIKNMKSKLNFRGDVPLNLPLEIKSNNIEKFNNRYKK